VLCSRNLLNNFGVIAGKLAIANATRNPGNRKLLDTRFRGYDGWTLAFRFADFSSRTLDTRHYAGESLSYGKANS
jgi:hypothetical protein